jgi:hypothetical protein
MRRSSYLARIVEDMRATKPKAILTPPRLLFRPTAVPFDLDAKAEPTRVRASTRRGVDSRRSEAGAPELPTESKHFVRSRPRDAIGEPTTITARLPDHRKAPHLAAEPPTQRTTITSRQQALELPRLASEARQNREPVRQAIAPDANHKPPPPTEPTARAASPVAASDKPQSLPAPRHGSPRAAEPRSSPGEANGRDAQTARLAIEPSAPRPSVEPLRQAILPATRLELVPPEPRASAPVRKEFRMRAGQVHIGTLEVRIIPPPPAPRPTIAPPIPAERAASPAVPSRPLARGFDVFGFLQG